MASGTVSDSVALVGRHTWQAMRKMAASKTLAVEKRRRKRGAMKPQTPATTSSTQAETSFGVVSDMTESPSPDSKRKKAKLLDITVVDAAKIKERLNADIHSGKQREPTLPSPALLRPKFHVKKSSM